MSLDTDRAAAARLRNERQRARGAILDRVTVVAGAPCSGKTTFVEQHAAPGDVVIDFDRLAVALGSPATHDHSPAHIAVAMAAREAAIARAVRLVGPGRVWVIVTSTSQIAGFGLTGARVHVMDTPVAECVRRARAAGRSQQVLDVIRSWQQ